jgi:hypothetical protein
VSGHLGEALTSLGVLCETTASTVFSAQPRG